VVLSNFRQDPDEGRGLEMSLSPLHEGESLFRLLIENVSDIVTVVDAEGILHYESPSVERLLGYKPEELTGKNVFEYIHPDDAQHVLAVFTQGEAHSRTASRSKVLAPIEFRFKHRNGTWRFLEAVSNNLLHDPNVKGIVVNCRDITERKLNEEMIRYMAYYDTLTHLPNRPLFNDRLTLALAQAHRNQQMLAVMLLDLDQFKTINDTLGHDVGDHLLKGVAERLVNCLREGDTVARLGGDEFMLLLPGITQVEDVHRIAQKILNALKLAFHFDGHELHITASIGISLYPSDSKDAETLIKKADTALHRAKAQGRNNYQFNTQTMNAKALERLMLESSLRRALERGELIVYYQPQIDVRTGKVIGMEALARFQSPQLGEISPTKFIPLAEEIGLIVPLDEGILRAACAQNKAWQNAGFPPLRMAVNMSTRHFRDKGFVDTVMRILEETGLHPNDLELELTESIVMENTETTISMLRQLKQAGIHLSIDDFGTGYSSLSYLKRFPLDALKIDQSFVRDISTDPDAAAITTAIIAMAHGLKLKVIAEGVETREQLIFLRRHYCDGMQGYLFGKPMPADVFTQLFQKKPHLIHRGR